MTIQQWLLNTIAILEKSEIPTPRLDAELLLAGCLEKDRSWLHAHPETTLNDMQIKKLAALIERRALHEPIAYIRSKQEFYGRDFLVSPHTLTPRPETETLIELALKVIQQHGIKSVADIGTGSGCIIISLALEANGPQKYTGYDISESAIKVAQKNAEKLKAEVVFEQDDITQSTKHAWRSSDLIVANLPYVPEDFHINLAATHEPDFAIFGGEDGLYYYRHLFSQLQGSRFVITESLPMQHKTLKDIAALANYKEVESQDLIQVFRLG
ncbi:peptide chain release factor N(5)-glutamine methyltransferase [Candidatus Saccharibacteria bacterium]|nr:peptide chain release factor N(5)-glutamine methyltransferase [Candidatus Saccharibacteria bacterium]MCA9328513.1 peptide chain release factor N(5)-glutamine methyltransferase [Candidatus Saccharibacteria bacterium]